MQEIGCLTPCKIISLWEKMAPMDLFYFNRSAPIPHTVTLNSLQTAILGVSGGGMALGTQA